jgi:hypothetical protein
MVGSGVRMYRTAAVVLVLLAVTGCAAQPRDVGPVPSQTQLPSSAVPSAGTVDQAAEAAVLGYYTAIAAHDAAAARSYLSPEYYKGFSSPDTFRTGIANYLSLTHLRVGPPPPMASLTPRPGYSDLAEVHVSYDAVLKAPSANETTGPMERFVVVGRKGPASPWLILDIGTGP